MSFEVLISLDNINESESAEAVQTQLAADINPNSKARGLIYSIFFETSYMS